MMMMKNVVLNIMHITPEDFLSRFDQNYLPFSPTYSSKQSAVKQCYCLLTDSCRDDSQEQQDYGDITLWGAS